MKLTIDLGPIPAFVTVYIDKSPKKLEKFVNKNIDEELYEVAEGQLGVAIDCSSHQYVWVSQDPVQNPGLLAHELLHATKAAMKHASMKDEELECYVVMHLINEVTKKWKRKKT